MHFRILFPVILLIAGLSATVFGQVNKDSTHYYLSELKTEYEQKKINDTAYLEKVNMLLRTQMAQGVSFSNKEMLYNLSLFREITWSHKQLNQYKRTYYGLLANQAQMANRGGEMFYYAEKLDSWEKETFRRPSLAALSLKTEYYKTQKSYNHVKDLYTKSYKYFRQIPGLIQSGTLSSVETVQAFMLLEKMSEALCENHDTLLVNDIYQLVMKMFQKVETQPRFNTDELGFIKFSALRTTYNKGAVNNNTIIQRGAIADMTLFARQPETPEALTYYSEKSALEWKIDYYTTHHQPDSALYSLQQYQQRDGFPESSDARYFALYHKALNEINSGDYQKGAETMKEATLLQETANINVLKDVDQVLYAQTEAEEKKIELAQAGKMVKNRTRLALIVFLISVLIISGILAYFYWDRKRTQKRINILNDSVYKQVNILEKLRMITIKKERERISRDIHDNLSPSLASIMHQIELLANDATDHHMQASLQSLKVQTKESYHSLRDLSHSLFAETEEMNDLQFETRIKTLINNALPDRYFKKNIHISEGVMQDLGIDTRIEILLITQEAITNIIKHASAKAISILLYEEKNEAVLHISDDGKGFDITNILSSNEKMGLTSIRRRAKAINGMITINSSNGGTSIDVRFPLKKVKI
ncbi:sensor histidine kinase [Niabella sp. CJ426]|uniref:sensor histidine kinase n=1 Tax=Niabella sp. CJ426 TaxID=3393740 RepID=UPI003D068399